MGTYDGIGVLGGRLLGAHRHAVLSFRDAEGSRRAAWVNHDERSHGARGSAGLLGLSVSVRVARRPRAFAGSLTPDLARALIPARPGEPSAQRKICVDAFRDCASSRRNAQRGFAQDLGSALANP